MRLKYRDAFILHAKSGEDSGLQCTVDSVDLLQLATLAKAQLVHEAQEALLRAELEAFVTKTSEDQKVALSNFLADPTLS